MKTDIFKLVPMLLLLAGGLVFCEDKGKESLFPEPVEIPCTEYLLPETDCRWINTSSDRVIVINSAEELENHLPCTAGASYPEIDFSKNSLLLAPVKNVAGCNIDSRTEKLLLKQLSASKYVLSVHLIPSDTANTAPFFRHIAMLTPKMAKTAVVNFTVYVCQNNNIAGTWAWNTTKGTIILKFYPNGEHEGKVYSTNMTSNMPVFFENDVLGNYRIEGNMLYLIYPDSRKNSDWFILQHTEKVLELEYADILPTIIIDINYIFKAQN